MPWGAGVSPGEGTGGSSFNPGLTMDFSLYHISLCLRLPSVKCSYTCPCLVMRELQGQLRGLIPKQEKSQGGNSSVSNSRRCGCTRVSHGSSGTEKVCQTNDIPPHTGWTPLPTLS